jgi:galactokinase/mevalonate kinase-like predicted kinase
MSTFWNRETVFNSQIDDKIRKEKAMAKELKKDMEDKPSKKWWTSKTLWTNVIGIGLLVANYFGVIGETDIPPEYALGGTVAFVVNLILRFVTSKKLIK